jgi:hypothetical protein
MWRSLVAHFVRDEGAAGSNPVIPIVRLCHLPDYLTALTNWSSRCIGIESYYNNSFYLFIGIASVTENPERSAPFNPPKMFYMPA